MLEIENLSVSYGRGAGMNRVLDRVNLSVSNEKVVIIGPNGSGKSTLFKAVLGYASIENGAAKVFGVDVRNEREEIRLSTNLPEAYQLVFVPCYDLVKIFADLKGGDADQAFELFHDFELDHILDKRVHELSTGQQKMFGNIMAVSFSPKLILLDEPFDNVDETRRRRLVRVFKDLDSEILIITHEFNLLSQLDGWGLYFMLDGKLWGRFSASELDQLYLTKGVTEDAIQVMDTNLGKISITKDHGNVAIRTASNISALMEAV